MHLITSKIFSFCWLAFLTPTACLLADETPFGTGFPTRFNLSQWEVSLDQGQTFQPILVPGTVEDQLRIEFDGVSIYRINLPLVEIHREQSVWLKFQGVATAAKVYLNEQLVGEHLGGWTPFQLEITEFLPLIDQRRSSENCQLKVVVDEKVGHNTQGFLPIITHHFGGIWQPVEMRIAGKGLLDDQRIAIRLDRPANQLQFEVPVLISSPADYELGFFIRPLVNSGEPSEVAQPDQWHRLNAATRREAGGAEGIEVGEQTIYRGEAGLEGIPIPMIPWDLAVPQLYEIRIMLYERSSDDSGWQEIDQWERNIGFRDFVVQEDGFLLNGHSVNLRGLLNWGYAPPGLAPTLDEAKMRSEIEFAQARGFNLMKFCLWVPPRRYLQLCDEMGMLAWIEYPTWHPKLDQEHLDDLRREYQEFFEYDRNYAAVVLRSLTCETGPSADLEVIQALYDQCKRAIPGAIVVDDSSWISWNRIFDFYDDHPYGNNHTWVESLARLKDYIAERDCKPLVLGEAIAADTWTIPTSQAREWGRNSPAHGAWAVEDNWRWQTEMLELAARQQLQFRPADLFPHSRHYGMLMRKYQIEAFHREVPRGGYVVSVIRDFPKAAMGLIDFEDRPKFSMEDWQFQGERMLLLRTEQDRRSFVCDEPLKITVIAKSNQVSGALEGVLEIKLFDQTPAALYQGAASADFSNARKSRSVSDHSPESRLWDVVEVRLGALSAGSSEATEFELAFPDLDEPRRFILRAQWRADAEQEISNEWPLWVFPAEHTPPNSAGPELWVHASAVELAKNLALPATPRLLEEGSEEGPSLPAATDSADQQPANLLLTRRLNREILQYLGQGGRVLMLPDGGVGSFALSSHWFLRGGPALFAAEQEVWNPQFLLDRSSVVEEQAMLIELQHFDLGGRVIPEIDSFLNSISPRVLLWDNHDQRTVKTHGLVFRMEVGAGVLWVSALNHEGSTNSVGRWLVNHWLRQLGQPDPKFQSSPEHRQQVYRQLEADLNEKTLGLQKERWRFRPVPKGEEQQVKEDWASQDWDDSDWDQIRIDRHWESQGYENLDHWAWYRRKVELPADWSGQVFLNFTGIDDYAEIYVNGKWVGSMGDLDSRTTAFDQQASFDLTELVQPGQSLQIAVAVYDWYGAGGIFRPVSISNRPLAEKAPILIGQ
jgi:beta-galactosidase/beta-glucuronidase